jgi:transposase
MEASMEKVSIIGLDIAKSVFQAHGADASGGVVFRKKISRAKLLEFFTLQPPCTVVMEACGGAHHWAREITRLGHEVKLIAPKYVKPFVKRQKNDVADAEAICEAACRPTMRFVAVKSETVQASALVFRTRDILVRQRTQISNAVRDHLTEYGIVPRGAGHFKKLVAYLEDPASPLPEEVRSILSLLAQTATRLEEKISMLDKEVTRRTRTDEVARRLMTIPGVGPITATAIAALAPPAATFRRGRDFAAWVGLTRLQKSTGGKQKLGATSTMGERTLRRLLIIGAAAAIHHAVRREGPPTSWLGRVLVRKPRMLVTVALANKTARIV